MSSQNRLPWCFIFLGLFLGRFLLLFRQNIHWDEFFYLSQIYDFSAGRLADALQTFHVRLFLPLTSMGGDETNQIVVGRGIMFLCSLGSAYLMFRAARTKVELDGAILALILWLSLSETLIHGNSFRSDPLCLFLVLLGLTLMMRSPFPFAVIAGGVLGLSLLVSLKSALILLVFCPLFLSTAGIRFVSLQRRLIVSFLVALGVLLAGLGVQNQIVVARSDIGLIAPELPLAAQLLQRAKEFLLPSALPRGVAMVFRSCAENPLAWILVFSALVSALLHRKKGFRWGWLTCCFFAAIVFLYRNCFPYFLPTVVFPLFVFAAQVLANSFPNFRKTAPILGFALLINFVLAFSTWWDYTMTAQQELIAEVHRRYPKPVPYFDRCGMISSFPKVGPFLSSLVLERYKKGEISIFSTILEQHNVQFLILNSKAFLQGDQLSAADRQSLKKEFQPSGYPLLRVRRLGPGVSGGELATAKGAGAVEGALNMETGEIFAPY